MLSILLWFAWPGVHAYFNDDDILNLRNALGKSVGELILETFNFSPRAYRPVGLLWYKGMLAMAGLNPLPFRIVPFIVLLFNLSLLCAFTFTLTSSAEITLLAALFGCFHSRMEGLYFSSANIFDLLCYLFYFAALVYYVHRRRSSLPMGMGPAVLIVFLQVLGLGAKETAVTLPAILLVYEFAYHVGWPWISHVDRKRWWMHAGACVAASFAISVLFCIRKLGHGTTLAEAYHPLYSASFVIENWRKYLGYMMYQNDPAPLVLLAVPAAIALALRSKILLVSTALIVICPLPLMIVETRGLIMLYISMTGWAIFFAVLAVWCREKITSIAGHPAAPHAGHRAVSQTAAFLCMAALVITLHYRDRPDHSFPRPGRVEFIEPFLEELRRVHPVLPTDPHIVLVQDPAPPEDWTPQIILQIFYRRPNLDVASYKISDQQSRIAADQFNVVLSWRNGHLIRCENRTDDDPACRIRPIR